MKSLMKFALVALSTAAVAAATTASAVTYLPVGPQTNVAISTVTGGGWRMCYSATYATPIGDGNAAALSHCGVGGFLMLAGGVTGSDTLSVLAQAPYSAVTFNVGNGNTTHNANGTEWYFSPQYSWGFAKGGDTVSRNQCDTSSVDAQDRLCWHTFSWVGGWRVGAVTDLNDSVDYTKYIFTTTRGAIPEPAAWALMLVGLGGLGTSLRARRKAVAA